MSPPPNNLAGGKRPRFTFAATLFIVTAMCSGSVGSALRTKALLANIFTWWTGSGTIGTILTIGSRGRHVGTDEFGNRYFEDRTAKNVYDPGRKRRWVLYKGYADASKIPPDWHGWMHYTYDEPPSQAPLPRKAWEKPHLPNFSGTPFAQFPPGSLNAEAERSPTTGDYEAWKP